MTGVRPASSEPKVRRVRTYTWWSLTTMSSIALAFAITEVVHGGLSEANAVLVAGAAATTVQRTRFVCRAVPTGEHRTIHPPEYWITAIVAVALWTYGVVVHPSPTSWMPLPALIAGAVVMNLPARTRWNASAALVLGTCAAGATVLPLRQADSPDPLLLCVVGMGFVCALILIDLAQLWVWRVVAEVDRARATAGQLAVAQERLRFTYDLHDIQGHHLQAIVLKGELAQRLVGRDDHAARDQTAEVIELAREALNRTRELVQGYRHIDLHAEVTNAVELLHAAGARTEVHGSTSAVPAPLQQLFATLVREGTTNILRHSEARHCDLAVLATQDGQITVRFSNDGVQRAGNEGNGIMGLRERFATLGGQITAGTRQDGRFELTGRACTPERLRP